MKIKNLYLAVCEQLTRKGAWRNIFVTHNAFGITSVRKIILFMLCCNG